MLKPYPFILIKFVLRCYYQLLLRALADCWSKYAISSVCAVTETDCWWSADFASSCKRFVVMCKFSASFAIPAYCVEFSRWLSIFQELAVALCAPLRLFNVSYLHISISIITGLYIVKATLGKVSRVVDIFYSSSRNIFVFWALV